MKTLLLLLALALCSVVALADDIPTVDLLTVMNSRAAYDGQTVKVTFGFRDGDSIAATNGKAKGKGNVTGRLKVIVPDAGKNWFASLPAQLSLTSTQSAYVLIHGHETSEIIGSRLTNGQPGW